MNILLISVQKDLDTIGLKSLHYALLSGNHQSTLLFLPGFDPQDSCDREALFRYVTELSPEIIGISLMSTEFFKACAVTAEVRKASSVPVIWGGIHPTIDPEACLEHADFVCVGEGERTMLDIASSNSVWDDLRSIKNICYRTGERIVRNPLHPYIEDLDKLPLTDHIPRHSAILTREGIVPVSSRNFRHYARYRGTSYSIMSSRGCPFSCTYCCNNYISSLYNTHKVRRRSIQNIIAELEKTVSDNPEISLINFQDDSFLSLDFQSLSDLCSHYKKRVGRPFIIRCIPSSVSNEKLSLLKEAGLSWISMGLQSGSDRVCSEVYKRRSGKKQFLQAAGVISKLRIAAFYDVILDNPFENDADRIETAHVLRDTPKPFYTQFYSLTFYPGTELYEKARKELPGQISDFREKEYLTYNASDVLNNIIRISAYTGRSLSGEIIKLYLSDPSHILFKVFYNSLKLLTYSVFEPIRYFQVLLRANNGSFFSMLRQAPNILGDMINRYRLQFAKKQTKKS